MQESYLHMKLIYYTQLLSEITIDFENWDNAHNIVLCGYLFSYYIRVVFLCNLLMAVGQLQ